MALRLLLASLLWIFHLFAREEIPALYLSWYGDPSTTMTIQWHTSLDFPGDTVEVGLNDQWRSATGTHLLLPANDILVHTVELSGLKPDTEYSLQIDPDPVVYKFRTAPATLASPIRFIVAGDALFSTKRFLRMNQTIMENDPLFIAIGGDIAYSRGAFPFYLKSKAFRRWSAFFRAWKEQMKTADNRLIPLLAVPGNHDIAPDDYELFFSLFAFPSKQLYRAVDFGNYLTLLLLDTGHFQPIEGRQTVWLNRTLAERTQVPYRFAVYHQGAYPSHYSYQGTGPKAIRSHWCPLFDRYGLSAAFEHHNHCYKRTYPIKHNQIASDGIVYLGDGCWGGVPRSSSDRWYLAKRAKKNNIFLVTLSADQGIIEAIDLLNHPFDELTILPNQ